MLPNQPSKCQNVAKVNENCAKKMVYNPPAHELSQPGGGRKAPEERERSFDSFRRLTLC